MGHPHADLVRARRAIPSEYLCSAIRRTTILRVHALGFMAECRNFALSVAIARDLALHVCAVMPERADAISQPRARGRRRRDGETVVCAEPRYEPRAVATSIAELRPVTAAVATRYPPYRLVTSPTASCFSRIVERGRGSARSIRSLIACFPEVAPSCG